MKNKKSNPKTWAWEAIYTQVSGLKKVQVTWVLGLRQTRVTHPSHRIKSSPMNGPRFTVASLPRWSPILSAAFDTVEHGILLHRLDSSYQIVGSVQQWFQSYLSNRLQHMRVGSSSSSPGSMVCGVPQGSVRGAILFLLYCGDLQLIIESHGLCPHLYADDSQIYGSCRPAACTELQSHISTCIDHVAEWMRSNRLQLNAAKTEILWSAISRRLHQLPQAPLRVGNDFVTPSAAVRALGIHLDSDMSMSSHVKKTVFDLFRCAEAASFHSPFSVQTRGLNSQYSCSNV